MRSGTWSARTFLRAKPLRILAYVDARVRAFGVSARMRNKRTGFEVFSSLLWLPRVIPEGIRPSVSHKLLCLAETSDRRNRPAPGTRAVARDARPPSPDIPGRPFARNPSSPLGTARARASTFSSSLSVISFILSICKSSVTDNSLLGLRHPVVGPRPAKRGCVGEGAAQSSPVALTRRCWRPRKTRDDAHCTTIRRSRAGPRKGDGCAPLDHERPLGSKLKFEHLGMACAANDAASDLSELLVHQLDARRRKGSLRRSQQRFAA